MPTGFSTVIAFLVVIAPGFVLENRFRRRRPPSPESSFAEANRVVLSSLISSGLSIAAVGTAFNALHRPWYQVTARWLLGDGSGALVHLPLYFLTVAVVFVLSVGGVLAFDALFGNYLYGPVLIKAESAWRMHLADHHKDPVRARTVVVSVATTAGVTYRGEVAGFSPDHLWADRELVLSTALYWSGKDNRWNKTDGQFVLIPSSAIVSVTVAHGSARAL